VTRTKMILATLALLLSGAGLFVGGAIYGRARTLEAVKARLVAMQAAKAQAAQVQGAKAAVSEAAARQ